MTEKPLRAQLLKRRWDSLSQLVGLQAPTPILIIATRNYLQTLEGGTRRALWRWALFSGELWLRSAWDVARMRFCIRVLRMDRMRAAAPVFGEQWDD